MSQSSVLHNNTLPLTLANCRCYSTGFMKRQELKPCMVISRGGNNHSGVKFRSTALMMLSTPPHLQPEEVFWNPSSLSALSLRFVLYSIALSVWHSEFHAQGMMQKAARQNQMVIVCMALTNPGGLSAPALPQASQVKLMPGTFVTTNTQEQVD